VPLFELVPQHLDTAVGRGDLDLVQAGLVRVLLHPVPHGVDDADQTLRVTRLGLRPGRLHDRVELVEDPAHGEFEQLLLAVEVVVDGRRHHLRLVRDVLDAGLREPVAAEHPDGGGDDVLPSRGSVGGLLAVLRGGHHAPCRLP
jgi:hypothetical protein